MNPNSINNRGISPLIEQAANFSKEEVIGNNALLVKNKNLSAEKDVILNVVTTLKQQDLSALKELLILNKPNLPNSSAILDPDTAMVLLMDAYDKQSNQGIKNTVSSLKSSLEFRSNVNQEKLKKFEEQIQKQIEEAKRKAEQQTMSDVMLGLGIFAAIAGVVASIFTFGAAAPAVAVALVGLGMSGLDAANRIVQATDAQYQDPTGKKKDLDISISGLIRMTVERDVYNNPPLDANGKKLEGQALDDEINKRVLAATIVVNVLLMAGMIVGGAGAGYMAKEAGKKAIEGSAKASNAIADSVNPQTAQLINTVATTTQVGTEVVEGAMGVSTSIYGIQIANITFEKNELSNQKDRLEAWAKFITEEIKSNQETLTTRIKDVAQMWEIATESNANYYQSQSKAINSV